MTNQTTSVFTDIQKDSIPFMIFGDHDNQTMEQMHNAMRFGDAVHGVLCADGHLGYAHPIGGVIAMVDHVSISGVGFDIACGNMAVKLDVRAANILGKRLDNILDDIERSISFGIGRKNETNVEHPLLDDEEAFRAADALGLRQLAANQLGTVGGGNHYVDIFEDRGDGNVWIGVHFGSRGLGHKITTAALKKAGAKDGMMVDPAVVSTKTDLGREYLAGVDLCGKYAYAGREWVVETVRKIIGGQVMKSVHNHHNFAWKEEHHGSDLWVVRKGATPAFPGQFGFVGGSMGDDAVILRGVDSELSQRALYSTIHGAGRLVGRSQAKGKVHRKTGEVVRPPMFTRDQMDNWTRSIGVKVRGGDVDESPMCYRRLPDVLKEHEKTIEVTNWLRPIGVVMAPASTIDPYKD